MKQAIILISLLCIVALLSGCDEQKTPTSYFEIVTDNASFHEIIVVTSGEVFEKIGKSNLDLENQVKTPTIQKEIAINLFNKSKVLAKKGIDCEFGSKEIIVFENNTVVSKCFDSNEFDLFFNEVKTNTANQNSQNNFFLHLINYKNGNSTDTHIHSNGLMISNSYRINKMTSAQMSILPSAKLNELKQTITENILAKESNCDPFESNYSYIEIQKDDKYTYYYNCEKNSTDKSNFFNYAKGIIGG
jgi:hypothetical protein